MRYFDGVLCACLLVGCADRTLGGGEEEGSSAGVTSSGDATPTTGVDPSSPGTTVTTVTTEPGTSATTVTTEPGTSVTTEPGTSVTTEPGTSTSTSGPSTTTSTTEPGDTGDTEQPAKLDLPGGTPAEIPAGLMKGCTMAAPPGTAIKGMSELGPFFGTRAYFGFYNFGGSVGPLRMLILDDAADLDLAFAELKQMSGDITTGPAVTVTPEMQWTVEDPFWDGTDEQAGLVMRVKGEGAFVLAKLTISGQSGSWDVADPGDPPRLQGSIEPGDDPFPFVGSFDAVFCDLLTQEVIPE